MRVDLHQHVWTKPLLDALAARSSLPRVTLVGDEAILESAGEPSYAIDLAAESPSRRLALLEQDGLDAAIVAISSPIGIEALPRDEATALIDAHLEGVQALGPRFAAWGPLATDRPQPDDVDRLLDRRCAGISIPAGALATPQRLAAIGSLLERIVDRRVPLFVHPGPCAATPREDGPTAAPHWWAPLTSYVSQMQAAWLSFATLGRSQHPRLTVVFAMLAGTAPVLAERLAARGGPRVDLRDPRVFYDTSGFGSAAIDALAKLVTFERLAYGSDRPVVDPAPHARDGSFQENAARLAPLVSTSRPAP
jgi:6-methylsalicylate decarboxylase